MEDRVKASGVSEQRARLLRAAVGFALVAADEPEMRMLHRWLDSWRGVDDIVAGVARQGYEYPPDGTQSFGEGETPNAFAKIHVLEGQYDFSVHPPVRVAPITARS